MNEVPLWIRVTPPRPVAGGLPRRHEKPRLRRHLTPPPPPHPLLACVTQVGGQEGPEADVETGTVLPTSLDSYWSVGCGVRDVGCGVQGVICRVYGVR